MKKLIVTLGMVLALVAILFVPAVVIAQGTTPVEGEIKEPSITVTPPDAIDLGTLVWDETGSINTDSKEGSVILDAGSWNPGALDFRVSAEADQGSYMQADGGAKTLANMLEIQFGAEGWAPADAPRYKIWDEGFEGLHTFDFHVRQKITSNEDPGNYSIIITFTGQVETPP